MAAPRLLTHLARLLAPLALVGSFFACSQSGGDATSAPGADAGCSAAPYASAGPSLVGVASVVAEGVPVAVWYPTAQAGAEKASYDLRDWLPPTEKGKIPDSAKPSHTMDAFQDAPILAGKYPVILFSHGLGGFRFQSSFLMTHLASWGFVVIAPEHPERNLTAALQQKFTGDRAPEQLRAALAAVAKDSRFAGSVDLARVAAAGHSAGGAAVSTVAGDASIRTWVMLASPGLGAGPDGKPSLMMCGTTDETARCRQVETAWEDQPGVTRFVRVAGAGHLGFTDLCTIAQDRGGVVKLSQDYGVEGATDLLVSLATDGCRPTDLKPELGWPIIRHYVTSHLRASLGIDAAPIGLDVNAATCFGPNSAEVESRTSLATPVQPADAGGDAESPTDASSDGPFVDPSTNKIACAGATCTLPTICCVTLSGSSCKAAAACTGLSSPQACDGPEDCSGGQVCCAGFPEGASCKSSCTGSQQQLCHRDANCSGGATCRSCQFPGGPPTLVCSKGC